MAAPTAPAAATSCQANWIGWSMPAGAVVHKYRPTKFGFTETAGGWWTRTGTPDMNIIQTVGDANFDITVSATQAEAYWGMIEYKSVPGSTFTKTYTDGGAVDGWAIRLVDSSGNQLDTRNNH